MDWKQYHRKEHSLPSHPNTIPLFPKPRRQGDFVFVWLQTLLWEFESISSLCSLHEGGKSIALYFQYSHSLIVSSVLNFQMASLETSFTYLGTEIWPPLSPYRTSLSEGGLSHKHTAYQFNEKISVKLIKLPVDWFSWLNFIHFRNQLFWWHANAAWILVSELLSSGKTSERPSQAFAFSCCTYEDLSR